MRFLDQKLEQFAFFYQKFEQNGIIKDKWKE